VKICTRVTSLPQTAGTPYRVDLMSLRARILMLVLFVTLVPGLVIGLHLFYRRGHDIDLTKENLGTMAKYATENLENKVHGTLQLLHGLSHARELNTNDKAACSEFLAQVFASYPQYTALLTITPDGDLFCDSLRTDRKLNVTGREYFKQVRATLRPAYEVVIGGLSGIAVLQVAYPVLDGKGKLKYVLLGSLNLAEYAKGIIVASQYPELNVLVWNQNGVLMLSKPEGNNADSPGKGYAASTLFRFALSGKTGATADLPDLGGVRRVWALGVMTEYGDARIALGIPYDLLVQYADKILLEALFLLVAISILSFTGAWLIAETGIRRHVRRIAICAKGIGTGNGGGKSGPPYPRGELGELMQIIERTAIAVQEQQSEIESKSRAIQQVNRTLRMLSGINTLIVRVNGREELFREACNIAIEAGGFRMALIAIVDQSTMKIVPVASAGNEEGLLVAIKGLLSSNEDAPKTMVASAIMAKQTIVSNDTLSDHRLLLGKQYAKSGVRSMAIFPLIVEGDAVGAISLYASEIEFFHEEEMKLLTELAGDIAFAIDHIEKQERLNYLAYYDVLTGLANRTLFLERAAQYIHSAISGGHKLAIGLIDLERFKNINDSLGRLAGDSLLNQVAERLTQFARDANLLARIDADHFAFVVPEVKSDGNLAKLVENLMAAFLEHSFRLNDSLFRIGIKVGIALFPDDGTDADILFRNAEAALKKAKKSGDRYLFYTQKMTAAVAGKLTLENQLRQAIDNEEFVLHYQPKVNLVSGKVTSAEALIRWNDPRTGLVPPGKFIPILEETGLIYEVGRWALQQAITDYLRWRAAGLATVRIAVNVSPLQLRNINFTDEIRKVIALDAHAAAGLELEITESLIMEDVKHSITVLQAIRAMGVTIAIDDFGTGFSSLSYLSKLPVDTLKIDRAFVIKMDNPEGMALVSTIILLAHALKLKVVAEGVETEQQSRQLLSLNCDEMQGFLFSKPVPAEIYEAKFLAPLSAG